MNCTFNMNVVHCVRNLIIRLLAVVLLMLLVCDTISTDFPVVVICAGTALHLFFQSNTAKKLSFLSAKAESQDNNYETNHPDVMTSTGWKGIANITAFFGLLFTVEAVVTFILYPFF